MEQEKTFKVYKNSSSFNVAFFTKTGKQLNFIANTFVTDDLSIQAELDSEIAAGNSFISFVKSATKKELDPIEAEKTAAVDAYKDHLAKVLDVNTDMGETIESKIKALLNTRDIQAVSSSSMSGDTMKSSALEHLVSTKK